MTALIENIIGKYNMNLNLHNRFIKCAMDVNDANKMLIDDKGKRVKHKERDKALLHRYICCNNFLKWEIENLSNLTILISCSLAKLVSFHSDKGKEKYKHCWKIYI